MGNAITATLISSDTPSLTTSVSWQACKVCGERSGKICGRCRMSLCSERCMHDSVHVSQCRKTMLPCGVCGNLTTNRCSVCNSALCSETCMTKSLESGDTHSWRCSNANRNQTKRPSGCMEIEGATFDDLALAILWSSMVKPDKVTKIGGKRTVLVVSQNEERVTGAVFLISVTLPFEKDARTFVANITEIPYVHAISVEVFLENKLEGMAALAVDGAVVVNRRRRDASCVKLSVRDGLQGKEAWIEKFDSFPSCELPTGCSTRGLANLFSLLYHLFATIGFRGPVYLQDAMIADWGSKWWGKGVFYPLFYARLASGKESVYGRYGFKPVTPDNKPLDDAITKLQTWFESTGLKRQEIPAFLKFKETPDAKQLVSLKQLLGKYVPDRMAAMTPDQLKDMYAEYNEVMHWLETDSAVSCQLYAARDLMRRLRCAEYWESWRPDELCKDEEIVETPNKRSK